jgi:hypothetical protein
MPIGYYPGFLPGPLAWSRWFKPICTLRTAKRLGFDARGTDVCPVGGLTGFRQALPPPIHRMIWIELPAIEANIGSEPVELNESLRAAVAVLAEAHERAEPEFVGIAAMWLNVITNLCGRESR